MKKYYQILGLDEGATLDEVEKKYNELLKEFDPSKQPDELKEFFTLECEKVKEAYKEISLSLTENIEQVDDEINSDTNEIDSENEDLEESIAEEIVSDEVIIDDDFNAQINHNKKENKFSISSETELKLKRAYLIMFILGFPLIYLISEGELEDMFEVYYNSIPSAIITHLIGVIPVLLYHMFLIKRSSGFLSIRKNLSNYFVKNKKYFTRILAFTPLVLLSLYGWGGYFYYYEEAQNNWYEKEYNELKSLVSGDNYDSGCTKRYKLKLHNHTNQDLKFYVSYKLRNGEWSSWLYWSIDSRDYTKGGLGDGDGETVYTSDYRYYITTESWGSYLYSEQMPHIKSTCNDKCINIY